MPVARVNSTTRRTSGAQLFDQLVEEARRFLDDAPGKEFVGTREEFVEKICLGTDAFAACDDKTIRGLTKRVAAAINSRPWHGVKAECLNCDEAIDTDGLNPPCFEFAIKA